MKASGTECRYWADPPGWQSIRESSELITPEHAVTIDVHHASLEQALQTAGLERNGEGSWIHPGRQNATAEPCSMPYTAGRCVTIYYGQFRKDGRAGYQGLGESSLVVLSNGDYSAIITLDYGGEEIPRSFRFLP